VFTSILLALATAHAAQPAKHADPAPPAKAAAPKQQLQEVPYEDLGKYLNKRIVVRTTLRTERRGMLTKYTGAAIELTLDSGAALTMPRDTIRTAAIPVPPPDPLFPGDKK